MYTSLSPNPPGSDGVKVDQVKYCYSRDRNTIVCLRFEAIPRHGKSVGEVLSQFNYCENSSVPSEPGCGFQIRSQAFKDQLSQTMTLILYDPQAE